MIRNPLVSIIIPVYNAGDELVDAIVSASEQTYKNLEIICINDGSTDDSLAIMNALAAEDPRIVVIDKTNEGYGATCNLGIDKAKGTWISILEPDDWIDSDMIERMIAFRNEFDCLVDVIKTPYWRIITSGNGNERRLHCSYKGSIHPKTQPFDLREAPELFAHHPSIWSTLYRKAYLDEKDIRFPEHAGSGWADNRFLAETLLDTENIIYLDEPFYNYRATARSDEGDFASKNALMVIDRWNEMKDVMDRLHVNDEGLLMAHNRRGFTYLTQIEQNGDELDGDTLNAIDKMFHRMNLRLVILDPAVHPETKRRVARSYGIENHKPNSFKYYGHFAREGVKRIRNNGVVNTIVDILS